MVLYITEVLYMEKYILSKMKDINFSKAVNEIYLITDYNKKQYPCTNATILIHMESSSPVPFSRELVIPSNS